ncbi:MAG: NAD(P)-binding protein [Actinobacteria bacterium]|nr:NAD(P)-binding protein [Actinomycetota bacterium]
MDTPFAITLGPGSSSVNRTGTWRTERPVYVDRLPPCNQACPAGENVQGWLYTAEEGDYQTAWRQLVAANPFPAVMGRVCYHPCETACNRAQLDHAVGINSVEEFLGDEAIRRGWVLPTPAPDTGKRVLVVGAGPSGLSAAYQLCMLGHHVEIRDSAARPGGMMRYAIPTFRLPRDVLDAEIDRLLALGIDFRPNTPVTDLTAEHGFDAVFLAVGAQLAHRAYVPAAQSARILDALELLGDTAAGGRPLLGRTVAVYGGGNTAMDAARTARRLGADEAIIVYRRTRERMPANDIEVTDALEEGIRMKWLSTVKHADVGVLTIERMELDEKGVPQPTGELEELRADALVLALGQDVDHTLVDTLPGVRVEGGVVQVDGHMMTGYPGVFAGGDMVPSARSVTVAIGHGAAAARNIDAWLRGTVATPEPEREVATFERLNTWYYSDAPETVRPRLDAARRVSDFAEVTGRLDVDTALYEARRCMSCGNCFGCDNCYGVCPDNAIVKVRTGHGYAIDLDYCKGCALCVTECPAGAIDMIPEPD